MRTVLRSKLFVALALAMVLGSTGCGNSSSNGSGDSGSSSAGHSRADREAQSAALAELQRHWLRTADGWTAAEVTGSAYAPEHFIRQYRALTMDEVHPAELSEGDKLNGIEWEGEVTFKPTVCREAGGDGGMVLDGMGSFGPNRQRGRWTEWVDFTPGPMRFQKVKGQWQFKWDGSYLRGTLPGPQDYANAGVR
ncbi:MAG: hypothetical protein ACHQLQ_09155 [Candidatus Acidiferrales bacterium]